MRVLMIIGLAFVLFPSIGVAQVKNYYVKVEKLNVRLCPKSSCPVTNRVYRGQKIKVFELKGSWARISKYYDASSERAEFPQIQTPTVARWVVSKFLGLSKPTAPKQPNFSSKLIDSRIKGIPQVGDGGLSKQDVVIIRTYAAKLLKTGECSGIDYGDKSVSKPNTYYVVCTGEVRSRFFKP